MEAFVKQLLISLSPTILISKHLNKKYDYSFAVGKAASLMMQTVKELNNLKDYLVVSPYIVNENDQNIKASHPIPGLNSVEAGRRLVSFVSQIPRDAKCLALISGGASASVVHLKAGENFHDYCTRLKELIYSNTSIEKINDFRSSKSDIKNGGLLKYAKCSMDAYILSDVYSNRIDTIGSGLTVGANNIIIGDHYLVREKLAEKLPSHKVFEFESFDINTMAESVVKKIIQQESVYTTSEAQLDVEITGVGGRNQHLVLLVMKKLKEKDYRKDFFFMSCSTDGIDGTSSNAGAWIDQKFLQSKSLDEIDDFLKRFNSGLFFKDHAINTGPTMNNLLDFQVIGAFENV